MPCRPKVSPPFGVAEFDILYGDGINTLGSVVDVAKELDVIEARVRRRAAACPAAWARMPTPGCPLLSVHVCTCAVSLLSPSAPAALSFSYTHTNSLSHTHSTFHFHPPPRTRLTRQGSHYYFEGAKLAQGRDNVVAHLRDNPDTAARLQVAVAARLAEGCRAPSGAAGGPAGGADEELALFGDEDGDDIDDDDLLRQLEATA